jgi:tRNA (mo5U34)-methyltransferase
MVDSSIVPEEGSQVVVSARPAGRVSSSRFSPTLQKSIGMAWVPIDNTNPGSSFSIRWNERDVAARVVALDHYVWGVDIAAREQYWNECRELGTLPDHGRDLTDFWCPDLPGRRGFELAKEALNSSVEPMVADFATVDLDSVGTFDVVLYLGVLYHMKEPLRCLERLRAVTREVAVIETAAICIPSAVGMPLVRFLAGSELNRDFGNWYQPNIEALEALAIAAGFSRTEVIQGPPSLEPEAARWRPRRDGPDTRPRDYRAIIHAYV